MKNSKTFILLSILVAVLVLGVVYAAITENLSISAEATVAPDGSNFNVGFSAAEVTTVSNGADKTLVSAKVDVSDANIATIVIGKGALKEIGDTVVTTFTVSNTSKDLKAKLSALTATPTANGKYVEFTAKFGTDGDLLAIENGTTTVIVTAELIKAPVEEITAKATITFLATAEEA